MPTSPAAIKRFLTHKPQMPLREFRGVEPELLHRMIQAVGQHKLLTKTQPRTHQLEGVAFAIWAKRALLFYEVRTGKTKIALDWLSYLIYSEMLDQRALIIAHAPIGADEWEHQVPLHSFLDVVPVRSGPGSLAEFDRAIHGRCDAILVSWSTLQQMFTVKREAVQGRNRGKEKLYVDHALVRSYAPMLGACILDEIHMAGHHDTLRFGIASELIAHCSWRLGLTGTPFGRDPLLLWAQSFLIDGGQALSHSFYFFRDAFCTTKYNHFNWSRQDYVFDAKKMPLLREKMQAMTLHCELREVQDVNVLAGIVRLSMSRDQLTAYHEAIDRLIKLRTGDIVGIENTFVRLRQIASGYLPFVNDAGVEKIADFLDSAKFTWLDDFLSDPPDLKMVIFHEFIHSGARICKLLDKHHIKHDWLHGGSKDRPGMLARFQTGDTRVLVANVAAGGMAIDLSSAEYLMFFESPASVIIRRQAEARPLARGDRPLVMDDLVCAPIEAKLLDFIRQGESLRDALIKHPGLANELRVGT